MRGGVGIGMTPLSRRDRDAMLLALDYARAGGAWTPSGPSADFVRERSAMRALRAVSRLLVNHTQPGLDDLCEALRVADDGGEVGRRFLRARLALALRAVLRDDAGDYGRVMGRVCCRCGAFLPRCAPPKQAHYDGTKHKPTCGPVFATFSSRRITPLWQLAPATGTATRPAGLRRRGER